MKRLSIENTIIIMEAVDFMRGMKLEKHMQGHSLVSMIAERLSEVSRKNSTGGDLYGGDKFVHFTRAEDIRIRNFLDGHEELMDELIHSSKRADIQDEAFHMISLKIKTSEALEFLAIDFPIK